MKKKKIFFAYKHTDEPWGGANNFIRALYNELAGDPGFIVHHDINCVSDILFFNQLACGPGNVASGGKKRHRFSDIKKLKNKSKAKLVVRAVNLNINSHCSNFFEFLAYAKNGFFSDIEAIRLVNLADFVVFQSEFQKYFFTKWGYKGEKNIVIHNGASSIFQNSNYTIGEEHDPLRLVSNSNLKNFKRHDIIARMSLLPGVNITHVGSWSKNLKNHKVDVKGTLTHDEIVDIYKNSDYLLHPAVADPCPNSVIEALYFGLPVIYNSQPGSSQEIVRGHGLPIDEKNLEKTIQSAKVNFVRLKQKLAEDRDYYSIKRAASKYIEVFKSITNT